MGDPMRQVPHGHASGQPCCETARGFLAPRVPEAVPSTPESGRVRTSDLDGYRLWTPAAQERALDLIRQAEQSPWRPFYCLRIDCDGLPHQEEGEWSWPHARADQRPPSMTEEWLTWLLNGGRGGGKTRTGSEVTHRISEKVARIALVAPTGPDLRDTMVEGVSGLLATAHPERRPLWEPSKKRLTWPNGCIAQGFSAEEPDRLRGPQFGWSWLDEPAHMPLIEDVWSNLLFGLRLGRSPRVVCTTTPKPTKWMKRLIADPQTKVSRFSTYANLSNLSSTFRKAVLDRYEGTRLGRQELHAEILEDVEGALWTIELITYAEEPDQFDRIVVAIDPAGSVNKASDETGIIVLGISGKTIYVLADLTGKYSPSGWATTAVNAYNSYSADAIVAERNYGGDMVKEVLEKNGASDIRILLVNSRRGKAIRAEPILAIYERTLAESNTKLKMYHLRERTPTLEDEMTSWVPGEGASPNRVDALVHGATELAKIVAPAQIASPVQMRQASEYEIPGRSLARTSPF